MLKGDGTLDEMNVTGSGYYYGGKIFWCWQSPDRQSVSGPCTSANIYWDNVTPWPAGGTGEQQAVSDIFTCSGKKARTTPPMTLTAGSS